MCVLRFELLGCRCVIKLPKDCKHLVGLVTVFKHATRPYDLFRSYHQSVVCLSFVSVPSHNSKVLPVCFYEDTYDLGTVSEHVTLTVRTEYVSYFFIFIIFLSHMGKY